MGWVAASNALSKLAKVRTFRFDSTKVPWATFTTPKSGGSAAPRPRPPPTIRRARAAYLPLQYVDLGRRNRRRAGLREADRRAEARCRSSRRGRLVGATVVAPTGGDLLHEAAKAMQANMFVGRLAQTTHAYPT